MTEISPGCVVQLLFSLLFLVLLQIVFEATVGSSYDADIAIDDIVVTAGVCPSK